MSDGATLTRFFGFHVAVLPGITTGLLMVAPGPGADAGISSPPWVEEENRAAGGPAPDAVSFRISFCAS